MHDAWLPKKKVEEELEECKEETMEYSKMFLLCFVPMKIWHLMYRMPKQKLKISDQDDDVVRLQ